MTYSARSAGETDEHAGGESARLFPIRRATTADSAEVVRLWTLLQADNGMLDPRLRVTPEASQRFAEYLASVIDSPVTACFVAERDGGLSGFVLGQIHQRPTLALPDCGYATDIYVESASRLGGLGRALYETFRAWCHSQGVTTIEVQIVRASSASQVFWRKMGFSDFLRTLRNDA